MRGKERAALRAEANRLTTTVHVGHLGIVPSVVQSLDDALRTRELVKVQFSKNTDEMPKALAQDLAAATSADVVQVIGRTASFYRRNAELHEAAD
jgi:RNA-binding protein